MNSQPHSPSTLDDIAALLTHQIHLLWSHPHRAGAIAPLMLWGPPGVGKSTVVRSVPKPKVWAFSTFGLRSGSPLTCAVFPCPAKTP